MKPTWHDDVPGCALDDCPSYDGKRCRETGFRPGSVCEPAVVEAVTLLRKWSGEMDAIDDLTSIHAQTVFFLEEGPDAIRGLPPLPGAAGSPRRRR